MLLRTKLTFIVLLGLVACGPGLQRKEVKLKKLHNHRYAYYDDGSWWIYTDSGSSINSNSKLSFVGGQWVRSNNAPREDEVEEEEDVEIQENTTTGEPDASDSGSSDGGDSGGGDGGGSE